MRYRLEMRLTPADIGQRVVIRWRPGPADSTQMTDVLGILEECGAGSFAVRIPDGTLVVIPRSRALAAKVIPPAPPRRQRQDPQSSLRDESHCPSASESAERRRLAGALPGCTPAARVATKRWKPPPRRRLRPSPTARPTPVTGAAPCRTAPTDKSPDRDYETLRTGMQTLFHDLGLTATAAA